MTTVNDIGFAVYLKIIKNVPLSEMPCKGEDGKRFIFKFDINDSLRDNFYIEYINSNYRKFDQEVKDIKKILNQFTN